jgi:glycosyltransferase involved in cell wall biosynthesis
VALRSIALLANEADYTIRHRRTLIEALRRHGAAVTIYARDTGAATRGAIARAGATFVPVPLHRGISPLHDARLIATLVRHWRAAQHDALLCFNVKPVVLGGLAGRLAGLEARHAMITGRGYAFARPGLAAHWLRRLVIALYRPALRGARSVIFQNTDDRDAFTALGIVRPGHHVVVVDGSGVDLAEFVPVPFPDRPTFLFIGRLLREKGIGEFVAAARQLKARYPHAAFHVVGYRDGKASDIEPDVLEAAHDAGVVDFLGRRDDIRPALGAASVFVLPSYFPEGIPRASLEALAMGRPVVTADTTGCRETVRVGVNGFLVPPRAVTPLVAALERFLVEPSLVAAMGAASRRYAEERFDVRKTDAAVLGALGLAATPSG